MPLPVKFSPRYVLAALSGLSILSIACSGSTTAQSGAETSPTNTEASATKLKTLCAKYCGKIGASTEICETKLSPYSDSALDAYDACKGDSACINKDLSKKEPGPDAIAFGKWACSTCGVSESDTFCSDLALSTSPYSTNVLNENRTNCEPKLREAAAKSTDGGIAGLRTAECALAAAQCFQVKLYGGHLCTAP